MAVGNIVSRPRGILMEKVGNRAPYLIAAPAAAFTLLITFLNLPEESGGPGESGDVNGCFVRGIPRSLWESWPPTSRMLRDRV